MFASEEYFIAWLYCPLPDCLKLQVATLEEAAHQHSATGEQDKAVEKSDMAQRKRQDLQRQIEAAAAAPEHVSILDWQLVARS